MNVVFMGTPEFAVASLSAILNSEHKVVGVVTAPDKPAGRGRRINQSAVKQFAEQHNLNVLQPTNLKNPEFLAALQNLKAQVFVVVAFRMLPKVVWDIPQKGTFNLHASLLPNYRGAAPINWAIINGETKTGATTFFINEDIDTGSIIDSVEVNIAANANAGAIHDTLMLKGADLVVNTLNNIEKDKVNPTPQTLFGTERPAPKLNKENTKLTFNTSAKEVHNKIRGLSPYPGAYAFLQNGDEQVQVKVFEASLSAEEDASYEPGELFQTNKKNLFVQTKEGALELKELQLEGKKRMKVVDFLNGTTLKPKAKLV